MKNFAEKMWRDYNPHYLLSAYLRDFGHETFIALEKAQSQVNVERFFEYAYNHRDFVVSGHEQFRPAAASTLHVDCQVGRGIPGV